MGKENWQPIETLDRTKMQFVLVFEDGAIRLRLWCPAKGYWEFSDTIGHKVIPGDECSRPTHWMNLPPPPSN